jgi:hypothetical protein
LLTHIFHVKPCVQSFFTCPIIYLEVSLNEQHVVSAEKFITNVISINVVNAEQALTLYDDYKRLLHEEVRTRELAENLTLTREDYMVEVDKLQATESAIRENCPNEIRLQMISIDCAELNETLCKKATEAVQILTCECQVLSQLACADLLMQQALIVVIECQCLLCIHNIDADNICNELLR